jgi:hypothetical protein
MNMYARPIISQADNAFCWLMKCIKMEEHCARRTSNNAIALCSLCASVSRIDERKNNASW